MPRLTSIYTGKGDDGTTALGSGARISKDSLRVAAYGTTDELNSVIGMALAHGLSEKLTEVLPGIQNELFHAGSDLCFTEDEKGELTIPQLEARHVLALEALISELREAVGLLDNFILPGGSAGAAHLHLARTVCRRAEREVVALAREESVGEYVLPYLNRLSDALFVMARYENKVRGIAEPLWNTQV
ncbi:MAG: cob(I)yrinic acid a,c-diamide adenosyltransferase [Anaerolineales bacterium]